MNFKLFPKRSQNYGNVKSMTRAQIIAQSRAKRRKKRSQTQTQDPSENKSCDEPTTSPIQHNDNTDDNGGVNQCAYITKQAEIANLKYIKPNSKELSEQKQIHLIHISHRGHFNNSADWSASNMVQHNESYYKSLNQYHFINMYHDENDNDWFIFKINASYLMKLTQISIDYAINSLIEQYPFKILIQFMSCSSLKYMITSYWNQDNWSKPYYISPYILTTNKPQYAKQHRDTFNISLSSEYIEELKTSNSTQYIRISFIESHGMIKDKSESKYCVQNIKMYGVPLLNDNDEIINILSSKQISKEYKYEIENSYSIKLSPVPGRDECRILMKQHIFYINIAYKTIIAIKSEICEEYNRLCTQKNKIDNINNIILFVNGYGVINDMMDTSVLNKTLKQIGVKPPNNTQGFCITVGFC